MKDKNEKNGGKALAAYGKDINLGQISIIPIETWMYVPPIVWKGDRIGHIGINDCFFYVLEGECYLKVDGKSCIVRPGQLAFLPKGKMRTYTNVSERFVMYEMAFCALSEGESLMERLNLCSAPFSVTVSDPNAVAGFFESYCRKEMHKDPLFDIGWCSGILSLVREYALARRQLMQGDGAFFAPVLRFMEDNLERQIKTEELAGVMYMQTTYFIRRFGKFFGMSPQSYLNKIRMNRAMELLSEGMSIEKVAHSVGIHDSSYFSRVFKKHCSLPPGAYRDLFGK